MAWKCSLELTHVYNIYCGNTPPRAPQLRRSVGSHTAARSSAKHTSRGEGRYGLIYCLEKNSVIRKSAAPFAFTTRGIDTFAPPTDSARRNIGSPVISQISICSFLSVCLSVSVSSLHISARAPACVHGDVCRRHVDFYLRLPLCPVARKYFLGSPLIYHNRRLSTRSKLWTPGTITPFARRAIARVRNQLRP